MKSSCRPSSSTFQLVFPVLSVLVLFYLFFVNREWILRFFKNSFNTLSFFEFGVSRNIEECSLLLWTESEQETAEIVDKVTKEALARTRFNKSHPVKIFIHGFSDNPESGWILKLRDAYLKRGNVNVFSVDWYNLTTSPWYTTGVKNARTVGRYIANVVTLLREEEGISWDDIHLIGYSLGGQVAGHAGFFTEGRLGRITGLDPSGPLYHSENNDSRLDSSDAQFVDVIHAAGRWVAMDEPSGHVDFFPNLGRAPQPGCGSKESLNLICSHALSWRLFLESVDPVVPHYKFHSLGCVSASDFTSGRCCARLGRVSRKGGGSSRTSKYGLTSVAVMGDSVDRSARGNFYLYTNQDLAYAKRSFEESTRCCCDNRTEVCSNCK